MICAYCGQETKGTKEHIVSSGILDLFPECFLTFDNDREVVHQSDPVIKDVCKNCNNNLLSYVDSYAKGIIQEYFVKKYSKDDTVDFHYDLALIQKMCLKYAFNDMRSRKKNVDFFDEDIKSFILNEKRNKPLRNVTILAGLAINTSPVPDFFFGNLKLRWTYTPIFLSNSTIRYIDLDTGRIILNDEIEYQKFSKCVLKYLFRFNSLQLLMLCWEKNISDDMLFTNEVVLKVQYPYQMLGDIGVTTLSRCTSGMTYHNECIIETTWGQGFLDQLDFMYDSACTSKESKQYMNNLEKIWQLEEKILAQEHPR